MHYLLLLLSLFVLGCSCSQNSPSSSFTPIEIISDNIDSTYISIEPLSSVPIDFIRNEYLFEYNLNYNLSNSDYEKVSHGYKIIPVAEVHYEDDKFHTLSIYKSYYPVIFDIDFNAIYSTSYTFDFESKDLLLNENQNDTLLVASYIKKYVEYSQFGPSFNYTEPLVYYLSLIAIDSIGDTISLAKTEYLLHK